MIYKTSESKRRSVKKFKSTEKFKLWQKAYRKKRRSDLLYLEALKERKRKSHARCIVHNLWKRTKDRAIKKNYEFNIEESDVIIPEFCPILEIPIFIGTRKSYNNSPTIDRIDNSKGYIKGNIKIISMLANTMKNSATNEQLLTFCKNIVKYINKNNDIVQTI